MISGENGRPGPLAYPEREADQEQERARFLKRRADESVALAMDGRWDEAAQANRDIIAMLPNDPHAYNRLGKALIEMGHYKEARDAYARAIELDSTNAIAKRNVARLAALGEEGPAGGPVQRLAPHLFIAETGRSATTTLENADMTVAMRLTPGDQVELRRHDSGLMAHTLRGEHLGEVEQRMGLRLANLMAGGNMYAAAIVSADEDKCRIIIREVHQDPSQEGRPSFPAPGPGEAVEPFRPYTRERLVRVDEPIASAEEEPRDTEDEWQEEVEPSASEAQEGDVRLDEDDDSDEEPD